MGTYLNPSEERFQTALNSQIYVDKTKLIAYTNSVLQTNQKYLCISRPRRFGKTMAMEMLSAYYGCQNNSHSQFDNLIIAKDASYEKHLNKYNVISINMQEFLSNSRDISEMLELLKKRILFELCRQYRDIELFDSTNLMFTLQDIYAQENVPFVILIDEWDCVFREQTHTQEEQRRYLDFLQHWYT